MFSKCGNKASALILMRRNAPAIPDPNSAALARARARSSELSGRKQQSIEATRAVKLIASSSIETLRCPCSWHFSPNDRGFLWRRPFQPPRRARSARQRTAFNQLFPRPWKLRPAGVTAGSTAQSRFSAAERAAFSSAKFSNRLGSWRRLADLIDGSMKCLLMAIPAPALVEQRSRTVK